MKLSLKKQILVGHIQYELYMNCINCNFDTALFISVECARVTVSHNEILVKLLTLKCGRSKRACDVIKLTQLLLSIAPQKRSRSPKLRCIETRNFTGIEISYISVECKRNYCHPKLEITRSGQKKIRKYPG